jgi:hypothetical protein
VITRVRVFFNSPTIPTKSRDWSVLLFCDSTCLRVFSTVPIPPIKQGLSDVLLFCDYMC